MILTFPVPPSVNNATTVARGRKILSREYRDWRELASLCIPRKMETIPSPVCITLEIVGGKGWTRGRDLDNALKAVSDLLVRNAVILGDSCMHVVKLIVFYTKPDGDLARCHVTVEHVEEGDAGATCNYNGGRRPGRRPGRHGQTS